MFGIGGFELFLIILFAFLVFGPDKLPEIANTVGKAIAKFKNAKDDMTGSLNAKSFISDDPDQPIRNPIEVLEQAAAAVEAKRNKPSNGADSAKAAGKADSASAAKAASTASKPKRPGSAVEEYPAFAERKAAYERERAAKGPAADDGCPEGGPDADPAAAGAESGAAEASKSERFSAPSGEVG